MRKVLNIRSKLLFLLFIIISLIIKADELNMDELLNLKNQNLISEEEFKIFEQELKGQIQSKEELYDLNINSKLVSRTYKLINQNKKTYFPLKDFFKHINFNNYRQTKDELIVYLGSSLREEKINLQNSDEVFIENDEIYLEANKFSEIFLKTYTLNPDELVLRIYLSFDTPKEITQLLDISRNKLFEKNRENDLIYTSKRKLFDLGYIRLQLGQSFNKNSEEKKYRSDWDGNLGYQGGLLYGEVVGDFNLKEHELNTIKLKYTDLWKDHNLDIENRKNGSKREWGLFFYKDKGYYETSGGQVVIKETVSIGSRVELIYMGSPIEIKNDNNGVVEFDNPLIRTDRTYTLKIYQPDGKIFEKEIKTVQDYNLQERNQFEYKLGINENSEYSKYETDLNIFYGFTNSFTLGVGYSRDINSLALSRDDISGNLKENTKYLNDIKLELVYGGTYNALSYIFNISGKKTLDDFKIYKENNQNYNKKISLGEKYNYKYLNQFNYGKWKLVYEYEEFGKFYDEKNKNKLDLKYNLLKNTDIGYQYEMNRYKYSKPDENVERITLDTDYSWNKFLFSGGTSIDINDNKNNEYRSSVYYSGWQSLTGRLENIWTKNGDEYETKLSLYNNNFGGFFDFTTELSYSKTDKEKVSFKFGVKIDDWLQIDTNISDNGSQNYRVGIDKVIDLENPRVKLNNMDNSRVRVITFVDKNDNNILDIGEETVPKVEVTIGDQKILTNNKGEGIFYGIGNGVLYDLNVTIKKPSFTLGKNKIQVRSNFSSTIDAYIPIKPMLSLSGNVVLDSNFKLSKEEMVEFYNSLIIELKDFRGRVIETAAPDNEGMFEISGLFPKEYYIEVTYIGTKYDLKTLREEIELTYSKESATNIVLLKITNNNMILNTTGIMKNMVKLRR